VIDPEHVWKVDLQKFCSRGKNSPFAGRQIKGRAVMTIVGGDIKYNILQVKR